MNKKIISLFLAAVMALGTFTACSQTNDGDEEDTADVEASSRTSMTLSFWLPTEKETTEEAKQLVEDAVNRITQAKYDTAIELHLIPRDEYQKAIDDNLSRITEIVVAEEEAEAQRRRELRALKAQGIKVEDETEETTETESETETTIDEIGFSSISYPEVGEKQMDIFLVQGYENYTRYVDEELIQQLDSSLGETSKILKTYIYPTFFSVVKYNGGIYAIPNNQPASDYQYLLVNKELVDEYDYDPDELTTFLKCGDFIKDIGYQHLDGVTPLLGEVDASGMVYWGINGSSEWSVLASQILTTMSNDSRCVPKSVFATTAYVNTLKLVKELESLGYVGDGIPEEGEKFAVGVISGGPEIVEKYGDEYYTYVYSKPMFEDEQVFDAMFAVSTYSKSLSRSMEILTLLNTDTEFRTVLQYGVEGIHWEYTDEEIKDTITILNDDYQMKLTETGNVYMTYPGEGRSMDEWEYAKVKNLNAMASPFLKFPGYVNEENQKDLERLATISADIKARIDACPYSELDALLTTIKNEIKINSTINKLLNDENENSVSAIYQSWYSEMYP